MKCYIFWDITVSNPSNVNQRVAGNYCLCCLLPASRSFLLGLLFDPEEKAASKYAANTLLLAAHFMEHALA
jgi:hypothetical protein